MPAGGVASCGHDAVLSYEDMLIVARVAAELGIEKVRVTGGEPLVRKGVVPFLEKLCDVAGIKEVALTTNGLLLEKMAGPIRTAGVKRINMSLDSLNPLTYCSVTRGGVLKDALAGLEAARAVGLGIKLNVVVMKEINDNEIEDFAALSLKRDLAVRFIEYMPVIRCKDWRSRIMTGVEIVDRLRQSYLLEELSGGLLDGPAKPYRIAGAAGTLGVITPMSEHFCQSCNRIRVTARGQSKSCLLADGSVDLRPALAAGDEALRSALEHVVAAKGLHHNFRFETDDCSSFSMAGVGG